MSSTATNRTRKFSDRVFTRATVSEVEPVAARMRRIRLAGSGLASLSPLPGQQLRIVVNDLFSREALRSMFRNVLRTYSVWDHIPRAGTVDLCVLDHGDGPGARWARQVRAGNEVLFGGPEGQFTLQQAAYHLFVGEETAQVAFGAMLRALPHQATVHGIIKVDEEADRVPLAHGEAISWLSRHGASAECSATLIGASAPSTCHPNRATPTSRAKPRPAPPPADTSSTTAAGPRGPSRPGRSGPRANGAWNESAAKMTSHLILRLPPSQGRCAYCWCPESLIRVQYLADPQPRKRSHRAAHPRLRGSACSRAQACSGWPVTKMPVLDGRDPGPGHDTEPNVSRRPSDRIVITDVPREDYTRMPTAG
ncbi:MAG: siderophore-interacting protein [Streptosporangiaceae bacterium]